MKSQVNTRSHILAVTFLLCVTLFVSPWSSSSQPSGFSLTLDLDDAKGDQAVSSLDLKLAQPFSVQIFGEAMQNASGITAHIAFDTTQVAYVGFDTGTLLPNARTLVEQDSASVRIEVSSLTGSAGANAGLVGAVRFRTTDAFSDTEIWLVQGRANAGRPFRIGIGGRGCRLGGASASVTGLQRKRGC